MALAVLDPPKVEVEEVEILSGEQVLTVLRKLEGHATYSIVPLDLATGLHQRSLVGLPIVCGPSSWLSR
jgi:hypothetical protein